MAGQRWRKLAVIALLGSVIAGAVIFTHDQFTTRYPGGNDSVPRWVGTLAWAFEGLNPYSDEVTDRAQRVVYGRLAHPEEDKQRFAYPFYVVFFYLPLAWLSYEWARAIGMVVLQGALILTVIFSLRMYRWSPPPWLLALTAAWAVVFYHGARTIVLWQFAGLAAMLIAAALWAIRARRDVLAGVCLALASAKPQMLFLLLPLIGVWSLTARRWKLALSLGASLGLLAGSSFLFVPTWLSDMVRQWTDYTDYTHIGSPVNILTRVTFPSLGAPVEWALTAGLIGWLVREWWFVWRGDEGRFDWVVAFTLVVTNLVALRTATTNYVMMLPVLIYLFAAAVRRRGKGAHAWIVLTEGVLLVGLWAVFLITVEGREEQPPIYLPLPLGLLAGLLARTRSG